MPNVIFLLLRRMRTPLIVLITIFSFSMLGFVLIPGIDDKGNPWHMGFFHALYVVTYTATTIGFGELPYLFTDAQRLWMTCTVIMSVVGWLYSIGALLAIFQDPAFRVLLAESKFRRSVARIREPFYLICGYGDTGGLLVRALSAAGVRTVVLDVSQDRISTLEVEDLPMTVPGLAADAAKPDTLLKAGLKSPHCAGVAALTNVDKVNVHIALASRLLHPGIPVVARADTRQAAASLRAFGTPYVINPFDEFAKTLRAALHAPALYALFERLTGVPQAPLTRPVQPPHGHWLVVGFGRFGKAIHEALTGEGIEVTVIERDADRVADHPRHIVGYGTDTETLVKAGVRAAQGVVAATDNDANNLSLMMSARDLNPNAFLIARQNQRDNELVFDAANLDMVMQHGGLIAHVIYTWLTTPLIVDFLRAAESEDDHFLRDLLQRVDACSPELNPDRWVLDVRSREAPALSRALSAGVGVSVGDVQRDTSERTLALPCFALLLKRGDDIKLLPAPDTLLQKGDSVLFCGSPKAARKMRWTVNNHNVLSYILTGTEGSGAVLQRLSVRRNRARLAKL